MNKAMKILGGAVLWLAAIGLAQAQANAIEGFDVAE